jgi:16S rRNA (uracil1498-N3)-methyltransferase
MQLFYTTDIKENIAILHDEEARHCTQVLRKKVGDSIHIMDGIGNLYTSEIIDINKKNCFLKIISSQYELPRAPYIHIGISPTKNIDRFEWFLEKATELGVNEITPIICKRSERDKLNHDRLKNIVLSATKQSMHFHVPILNQLNPFQKFIATEHQSNEEKLIAYCDYDNNTLLKQNYSSEFYVKLLIGPEGDFTPEEVKLAFENNYKAIGLGPKRLRTETAGLAAVHNIRLLSI